MVTKQKILIVDDEKSIRNSLKETIEDEGYEAVPMGHQSDWRAIDNLGYMKPNYSRPIAPGKAAPDVMINLRIAGFLCGLGERSMINTLLTKEYGPFIRYCFIKFLSLEYFCRHYFPRLISFKKDRFLSLRFNCSYAYLQTVSLNSFK